MFRKFTEDTQYNRTLLRRYAKKIVLLYAFAIAAFIPLNLYTGYFTKKVTFYSIVRDILFDGTFYHLWFFPSLLIGVHIVYFLYNKVSRLMLLLITGTLFLIGLFGDSYYGLAVQLPGVKQMYDGMFQWFDYTRNGLFFAPLPIALGAIVLKKADTTPPRPLFYGVISLLSLALLMAEGSWLREAGYPRHESMYAAAILASYFLCRWAVSWKLKDVASFRKWRVWIYLVHPLAVVLVRGASKAANLDHLFIANTLLHYLAVCLLSIVMSAVIVRIPILRKLTG